LGNYAAIIRQQAEEVLEFKIRGEAHSRVGESVAQGSGKENRRLEVLITFPNRLFVYDTDPKGCFVETLRVL
jgi:hypothetical protein